MKIIEFNKKLIQSFFISFLVVFPVYIIFTIIFVLFIVGVSYVIDEESVNTLVYILWSPFGADITYACAFIGTVLYKCGYITFKNCIPRIRKKTARSRRFCFFMSLF